MPGFLRRINGLRRKERLAGSNALVTGSGRITSANATCEDYPSPRGFLVIKVCGGEPREHDEQIIAVDEVLPLARHRKVPEA